MSTTVTTTTRTRKSPAALGIAAFLVLVSCDLLAPCFHHSQHSANYRNYQVGSLFFWLSAFSVPFIKSIYYVRTRENGMKVSGQVLCQSTLRRAPADPLVVWQLWLVLGRG